MTYSVALQRFIEALTNREIEYNKKNLPNLSPAVFSVNPGRVFDKVVRNGQGSRSVYCFIRKSNGAIIKPATWNAPEPKKYERGNIYNADVLKGTNVYGVDYIR